MINVAGFPITHDTTLRRRGEHEGVAYEIQNHNRQTIDFGNVGEVHYSPSGGTWCYYVTICEAQLPPELFAEFWLKPTVSEHRSGFPSISYDYFAAPFAHVEWHGGITFYEKLGGLDGAMRYVKMGCDFAHSWDEGCAYDYAQVEREAIETVRQLQAMYPFYRRCPYFGTYHAPSDMVKHSNGQLYSAAGIAALKERP